MTKTCNLEEATVAEKEKRGKENEDMILRIRYCLSLSVICLRL